MSLTAKPEYVIEAKALRNRRAFLLGGGQLGNAVILCTVKGVTRDGHARIDSGDAGISRPFLCYWYLRGFHPEIEAQLCDVPNGSYYLDLVQREPDTFTIFSQGLFSVRAHYSKTIQLAHIEKNAIAAEGEGAAK